MKRFVTVVFAVFMPLAMGKNISTGTININTASLYQLTLLPGVGKATAKKIIASRQQSPFKNREDLYHRQVILPRYITTVEPLIRFQGKHQYDDPNQATSKQKSKHQKSFSSHRKKAYNIDKAMAIKDARELILLTDGLFFHHLRQALISAKSEIWLSTFVFKTTRNKRNKANQIIQLLIKKARQGVKVKLVLEQSNYHQELSKENHRLAKRLRKHGISVFFDSKENTHHSKVVVIDRLIVFLGSHNMTDSALRRNHEVSLMIKSPTLSAELIDYFEKIVEE